jgi:hypothetical protein
VGLALGPDDSVRIPPSSAYLCPTRSKPGPAFNLLCECGARLLEKPRELWPTKSDVDERPGELYPTRYNPGLVLHLLCECGAALDEQPGDPAHDVLQALGPELLVLLVLVTQTLPLPAVTNR